MQATTPLGRKQLRNGRVRQGGRTLTFRELRRRAKLPGLYTPSIGGVVRALRDMRRATPAADFLLGKQAMDAVRETRGW